MKTRLLLLIFVYVVVSFLAAGTLNAWRGEPAFLPMQKETIFRIAGEMIDFSWSPVQDINNWLIGQSLKFYDNGKVYYGEAYTQNDLQRNWAEFYQKVNTFDQSYNVDHDTTYWGNDCSGFASISWKLPKRYGTAGFVCDANKSTNPNCAKPYVPGTYYVHRLGPAGSGENLRLLPGDAFVQSGNHMRLFKEYWIENGIIKGIKSLEQTTAFPDKTAVRDKGWLWGALASYMPIRRNKINDYNYVSQSPWVGFNGPCGVAVDSLGYV